MKTYSTPEAAKKCGVHHITLQRWFLRGRLRLLPRPGSVVLLCGSGQILTSSGFASIRCRTTDEAAAKAKADAISKIRDGAGAINTDTP